MSAICSAKAQPRSVGFPDVPRRGTRPVHCQATNGGIPVRKLCESVRRTDAEPEVKVTVSRGPRNSRFLFASLDVGAPADVIWRSLTDYDRLEEFVPSLASNECLERTPTGAILKQVGQQNLALGVKFCASVVIEVSEHLDGLHRELAWIYGDAVEWDERKWFPLPSFSRSRHAQDITFDLIRGDFQAFKGLWRIQQSLVCPEMTELSYNVFIRPQVWLPVGLIQGFISSETKNNLRAVKSYAEQNTVLL